MWLEKFKCTIVFFARIIVALILIAILFPILNIVIMHFDFMESLASFFYSHKFEGWNVTIYLLVSALIPFLICVVFSIALVLRFLGGDLKTAIFAGISAGLLHFMVAGMSSVTKSFDVFIKMGILQLLLIPLAALMGVFAYFVISKLNLLCRKH